MHVKTSDQPELRLGFGDWTVNWGVHICGLYETEKERDDIILGFLNQGDREGDLQLYIPSERSFDDFRAEYARRYPDCGRRLDDGDCFHSPRQETSITPTAYFLHGPWTRP